MNSKMLFAATAALLLSACAPQRPMLTTSGRLPGAGHFRIIDAEHSSATAHIASRLQAHGLEPSDTADYLVQFSSSERPASTGLLTSGEGGHDWLRAPSPSRGDRRPVPAYILTISDRATGRELYRASLTRPSRRQVQSPELIVDALLSKSETDPALSNVAPPHPAAAR